ncbi:MAG: hypothetical protein KOO69_05930, partial [Victivallales bacterium]|nr:hypothetical protein [Victivallales bacterium]
DLSGTSSHREKRAADLDNAAMKSDFHDAVVIHMYARVGVKGNAKLNHPNLDVLKAYKYALVYNDIRYPKVISQIKKNYPGKNIWITEYNIKSVVLKKPSNLSTTYLGRLFTSEFLLKMFSTRKLTAANWHNITRFVKYKKGKFEIAEAFDFLALFNKAVDKCQKTTAVTINGNKYFADKQIKIENADKVKHPEVRGTFFFGSKSGYLFLINRFGTTYTINSLTILQKNIRPVAISTIIPKSTDIIALKSKKHKIEHRKLKSLKNLIIKPYSINRIQLDYKN